MASHIKRGESLYIPFRNEQSISDSQLKPRMYKSVQNFEKTFPKHNHGTKNIELVEYKEVKHGEWSRGTEKGSVYAHCSACNRKMNSYCYGYAHCPLCGARMDGDN